MRRKIGGTALIEATSNQVDQTGGYSGLRPRDFRELVLSTAEPHGLPAERVVLGGDHLGPNRWRRLAPDEAMGHAEELIEAYVGAGFTKIHLDCSFPCAGDPAPLTDEIVSARTARLLGVAETAAARAGRAREPVYVIGTEVPVPGGERDAAAEMAITTSSAARATLRCHREAFAAHGLDDTWPRVIALVVQPGVDFDHLHVAEYRRGRAAALRHVLDDERHMVFEAHSTDYQPPASLRALVEDHWAILKVGPALTFALREAMFALAAIERELVALGQQSGLLDVIEERMLAEPMWWEEYYWGDERRRRFARRFSYSDRVRYYWADPAVSAAQERLLDNLDHVGLPLPAAEPVSAAPVRSGPRRGAGPDAARSSSTASGTFCTITRGRARHQRLRATSCCSAGLPRAMCGRSEFRAWDRVRVRRRSGRGGSAENLTHSGPRIGVSAEIPA